MRTCPECGNHDMQLVRSEAGPVHECGLCGARFGERSAVAALQSRDQAVERGIAAEIWPLVRAVERLPGLSLGKASAGGPGDMPSVELLVTGSKALAQIENLAKSLRLCSGQLRCRWRIEIGFERTLQLLLQAVPGSGSLRDAQIDVDELALAIERNSRLRWWQHANDDGSG